MNLQPIAPYCTVCGHHRSSPRHTADCAKTRQAQPTPQRRKRPRKDSSYLKEGTYQFFSKL